MFRTWRVRRAEDRLDDAVHRYNLLARQPLTRPSRLRRAMVEADRARARVSKARR